MKAWLGLPTPLARYSFCTGYHMYASILSPTPRALPRWRRFSRLWTTTTREASTSRTSWQAAWSRNRSASQPCARPSPGWTTPGQPQRFSHRPTVHVLRVYPSPPPDTHDFSFRSRASRHLRHLFFLDVFVLAAVAAVVPWRFAWRASRRCTPSGPYCDRPILLRPTNCVRF